MTDCKITKEYLSEKARMTNKCTIDCAKCCLNPPDENACLDDKPEFIDKVIEMVQDWSDSHPAKTYLSDFLEKFPNAPMKYNNVPSGCPKFLYGKKAVNLVCNMGRDCVACWNRPLED